MKTEEYKLLTKVKEYIFSPHRCLLCMNIWWCPEGDGFCPTYSCYALDKLKLYTDRQWLNTIRKVQNIYSDNLEFEDLVEEVLFELRYKRPRKNIKRYLNLGDYDK